MADSVVVIRLREPNQFSIVHVGPVPQTWNELGTAVLENHAFVTIDLSIPCNWVNNPPMCGLCQWRDPAQCDHRKLMMAHVLVDNSDPENPVETLVHKYRYEIEMEFNKLSKPIQNQLLKSGKSDTEKQAIFNLCISATMRKNQTAIIDKVV